MKPNFSRREFLKFVTASIAAAGATSLIPEQVAKAFSDEDAEKAMAKGRPLTYQELLNAYLPVELIKQELEKRDTVLAHIKPHDSWQGAIVQSPFVTSGT